jgi:hypothetical protein
MNCQIKEALWSYLRTASVAVASAVVTLNGDVFNESGLKAIVLALAIAIAGPAVRALNPNDPAFGKLVAPEQSEEH